jgi:transposase
MVEENSEMSVKAIANALGVSQPIVRKWAEDYQKLGIAQIKGDGETIVLDKMLIVLEEDEE